MPRQKKSGEDKRQKSRDWQKAYRAKLPLTAEEKARNRANAKIREQTPEYKACAAARYKAKRESASHTPRPLLCEVCNKPSLDKRTGALHWDHCHKTGMFRGWLCSGCNSALGLVSDNADILRKLADYLERDLKPVAPKPVSHGPLFDWSITFKAFAIERRPAKGA